MNVIRSRENDRVKAWMRLVSEPKERRERAAALIEGIHLVEAYLAAGKSPAALIVSESGMAKPEVAGLVARAMLGPVVLADPVFARLSDTGAPVGIAAEIPLSEGRVDAASSAACVFLEGIQDAGNVGAILRSAAALGVKDILHGHGCADPWSPKALRAGMGGHFVLRISVCENLAREVRRFAGQTLCTDAHGGHRLDSIDLTGRTGWIFGSEGRGVSEELAAAATRKVTIPTQAGVDSLNVAASAAICLYERSRQLSRRGAPG